MVLACRGGDIRIRGVQTGAPRQVRRAATELSIERRAAAGMAPREAKIRSLRTCAALPRGNKLPQWVVRMDSIVGDGNFKQLRHVLFTIANAQHCWSQPKRVAYHT
jgi:hypothetical protein